MISFLLFSSSLLNFAFYIYAIGFVIALGLEPNRKYLWRQTWVININWFLCNIGLYILSRNMQPMGDTFWDGAL